MVIRLDLHIHSQYSFDSQLSPEIILKIAKKKGLSGVAITDHNTIKGSLKAAEIIKINTSSDFFIIIGTEISTEIGDIIGLFLNEEINTRNSQEAIDMIKSQDGIVILPHPFRGHKLSKSLLNRIDVIEGFNAREDSSSNLKARTLAKKYRKPIIGGSDAHFAYSIGKGRTIFKDIYNYIDIKKAILNGNSKVEGTTSPEFLIPMSQIIKSIKTKKYSDVPFKFLDVVKSFFLMKDNYIYNELRFKR